MTKKIKSEKIYRVEIIPEQEEEPVIENGTLQSHYEYDENGNPGLEIQYDTDGILTEKNEYTYDGSGKVSGILIYDENGEVLERKSIERDEKGNILSEKVHYLDGSYDTLNYIYEDGKFIEKKLVDDEGVLEAVEKYSYSGDNLLRVEKINEEGELVYKHENEYDENGVLKASSVWSSEDGEEYSRDTEYYPNGHRKSEIRYDENERPVEKSVFDEDEKGRIIAITDENTARRISTFLEYNDKGNVIRQTEINMNDELNHEILREYDEEDNPRLTRVRVRLGNTDAFYHYALIYKYEYW